MGDLNAKYTSWNCITDNELGKYIFQQSVIVIHPGVHTFRHTANPSWTSTLDLFLTNSPHLITGCQALDYGPSDHRPIIYEVDGKPPKPPAPTKYNFSRGDWKTCKATVDTALTRIQPFKTTSDVDAAIDSLAETIIGSADYCIPKFGPKPNYQRDVPAHILQLVSQRTRLKTSITGRRTRVVKRQ